MTIVPAQVFRARDDFEQASAKLAESESARRLLAAKRTVAEAEGSDEERAALKDADSQSLTNWYALYTARKNAAKALAEALEIDPKELGEALR